MRTTLSIDNDVLDAAKRLAGAQSRPLGAVISELARKGLAETASYSISDGIPVFNVKPDTPTISASQVKELLEDEW